MNDQHQGGRGADWFAAHFNLSKEEPVGIEHRPEPDSEIEGKFSQAGCLIALLIICATILGMCYLGRFM